jgi:Putative stress-induced transcription regulator
VTSLSEKSRADRPEFIFVGDHPAIDFANTLATSQGQWTDHLRTWTDVIDWLSLAGLSIDPALQIPTSGSVEAVKSVVELRRTWKVELAKLVRGGKVSDAPILPHVCSISMTPLRTIDASGVARRLAAIDTKWRSSVSGRSNPRSNSCRRLSKVCRLTKVLTPCRSRSRSAFSSAAT